MSIEAKRLFDGVMFCLVFVGFFEFFFRFPLWIFVDFDLRERGKVEIST